jgi:hypothetical protein
MKFFFGIIILAIGYALLTTPLNQLGGLSESIGLSNLEVTVNMSDNMIMWISFIIFIVSVSAIPKKDGRFKSGFVGNRDSGCLLPLIAIGALIVFVIYAVK